MREKREEDRENKSLTGRTNVSNVYEPKTTAQLVTPLLKHIQYSDCRKYNLHTRTTTWFVHSWSWGVLIVQLFEYMSYDTIVSVSTVAGVAAST
jgi:hypothetical protein